MRYCTLSLFVVCTPHVNIVDNLFLVVRRCTVCEMLKLVQWECIWVGVGFWGLGDKT